MLLKASDEAYMRRAIQLSKRGFPAPNPHVGCVIVRSGEIVGQGYHDRAGAPHAEAMALLEAGEAAEGATAYVTLEPCNHFGRTPPCSQALIRAGVQRVVVATRDMNPRAVGGVEALRAAGIQVDLGLLTESAAAANRIFTGAISLERPYVIAKAAISLDGRIALPSGESKWITGPKARAEGHRLRAECGAVLVGRKTIEADDPRLTSRVAGVVNQPLRIVLDPENRLKGHYQVFSSEAETWHITGKIDLESLLNRMQSAGQIGLLVEGGAITIGAFMARDLVDEIRLFVAPKALGSGPNWVSGLNVDHLSDVTAFRFEKPRLVGPDTELSAFRIRP